MAVHRDIDGGLLTSPSHPRPGSGRDSGVTLIEILIAVVLMGLVVVGTMTLLGSTIKASRLDRDHSNAHAWLQTASDMLYARDPVQCDASSPIALESQRQAIMSEYRKTVRLTQNPENWPADKIDVVDLLFWHYARNPSTNGVDEGWYNYRCTTKLQLVKLRVRSEAGEIIEEVEVIIGGE